MIIIKTRTTRTSSRKDRQMGNNKRNCPTTEKHTPTTIVLLFLYQKTNLHIMLFNKMKLSTIYISINEISEVLTTD